MERFAANPSLWPKKVKLRTTIEFPAVLNGKVVGKIQAPPGTEANLRNPYADLHGVKISLNDTSRHFIMWDDPQWMFGYLDGFLGTK